MSNSGRRYPSVYNETAPDGQVEKLLLDAVRLHRSQTRSGDPENAGAHMPDLPFPFCWPATTEYAAEWPADRRAEIAMGDLARAYKLLESWHRLPYEEAQPKRERVGQWIRRLCEVAGLFRYEREAGSEEQPR